MKNYILGLFLVLGVLLTATSCSEEPVGESVFGTLTGKVVTKGDNTPLGNVKISSTPISNTVFSDSEGNFEITDIQVGEYAIQAELDNYQTTFEGANILEGKTVNIVFELDLASENNKAPEVSSLIYPMDGAKDLGAQIEFVWSSSANDDDEIDYTLELRNGSTNEVRIFDTLSDTTLVVENLEIGNNYFWQITSNDGVNDLVQSDLSGFSTQGIESNRFYYVRNVNGNNVIYSGAEPTDDLEENEENLNVNELQITSSNLNSFRPVKNNTVDKIAFLRTVGAETHLFIMNSDGSDLEQVTGAVPVAGFRQEEMEFTWYDNGGKLYYSNFNKLYSINSDGSGLQVVYTSGTGVFISEVAVNPVNNFVAIKTNDVNGYTARIVVVNVNSDTEIEVVAEGGLGALGGLDYSADAKKILFTRDISEVENNEYRRLDSRIFEYDLDTDTATEIETQKDSGTNDLDPKYAPDDGAVIFVNTSNDGISEKRIYRTRNNSINDRKEALFTNAIMPSWE